MRIVKIININNDDDYEYFYGLSLRSDADKNVVIMITWGESFTVYSKNILVAVQYLTCVYFSPLLSEGRKDDWYSKHRCFRETRTISRSYF